MGFHDIVRSCDQGVRILMQSAAARALFVLMTMAGLASTSCTTTVQIQHTGSTPQLADWAKRVNRIKVLPFDGPFFSSSGLAMVDTPTLEPNASEAIAECIAKAIRRSGGVIGAPDAPDLLVRIDRCAVTWNSEGAGIAATADVRLVASTRAREGGESSPAVVGHGVAQDSSSLVMLASSVQPMLDRAVTSAINRLLSAPRKDAAPASRAAAEPTVRTGTGFFVSGSGHIATAAHVVAGCSKVSVFVDDTEIAAKVVAHSDAVDIAILKIDATPPAWLPVAEGSAVGLGDAVFTIGFPVTDLLGAAPVYSEGVVNALSGLGGDASFLQISVPIQPGNSGGPLMLHDGRVVGVITSTAAIEPFLLSTGTLPQNINWAVRSDLLRSIGGWASASEEPLPQASKKDAVEYAGRAVVRIVAE